MRLIATRRIVPGSVLASDVTSGAARDRPLLRAGVRVTERYIQALLDGGHNAVYIEDDLSGEVMATPALTERTRAEATASLARAFHQLPAGGEAGARIDHRAVEQLEHVAAMIASEIAGSGEAVVAFSDLAAADAYTLQHSIDVCALGLMLAKRLFREQGRIDYRGRRVFDRLEQWLAKLGVGLLLHDVGKVAIPASVLNKPGKLDAEEWEIVRRHPLVGLELLSSDLISPLVKAVVRSHHERWDGLGYPHGTAGEAIPHFARIAAIADVFDAVTSERAYHPAAPQHVGHEVINAGAGTQFDADLVEVFNRVVAPWPPGDEIALADGRRGVVVACPHDDLARPLVRVGWDADGDPVEPEEIDLALRADLLPLCAVAAAA
jgi:HD-GYP domain-containing protein (c-di-GMP phosphodiesterase class II)